MPIRLALILALILPLAAPAQRPAPLRVDSAGFLLGDKPFQIISGEMHYARVPREYWRDRLRKAKAMGLNTISTYVFWNFHETTPGHFDFTGQRDIAEFVRTAQQEGLRVILRPGPYVCAEWELGGYPAWLLAGDSITLRSTDPHFTAAAGRWLDRLGKELEPLLASHGGPIIAVQVENEYGSFDKDKHYLNWQRDALWHAGFRDVYLYSADGDVELPNGTLPDLPAVVNFGPGEAHTAFARLAAFRPNAPLMSGEYWAGWFDQWGSPHHTTNTAQQVNEFSWMLAQGYSVNIYLFHGGTTPGFMNGANIDNGHYHPQTSSYDYDAALDESGRPTPKYFAFRDAIIKHTGDSLPSVPPSDSLIAIPSFPLSDAASLWSTLQRPVRAPEPRSMESLGQSYGYTLYRTQVTGPKDGQLVIHDVRDYVSVYLDGVLQGTLDRRLAQDSMPLTVPAAGAQLDLLVENTGRVNYGKPLLEEIKGISKLVTVAGKEQTGWDMYPLPMSTVPAPRFAAAAVSGPAFYHGTFTLTRTGDTWLDTRGWGKGTVWVNGHQLGRFWDIGPQQTLYVPGPWLRVGKNDVVVFDLATPKTTTLAGVTSAIWATAPRNK